MNYRSDDAVARIRELASGGVDVIVEVAPAVNAELDVAVCAPGATVAFYANNGGDQVTLPVRPAMSANLRWQGILVYTVTPKAKAAAIEDVAAAVLDGALRVGDDAGLPLHRYSLARTADAHAAVEAGAVGKVLIDVP